MIDGQRGSGNGTGALRRQSASMSGLDEIPVKIFRATCCLINVDLVKLQYYSWRRGSPRARYSGPDSDSDSPNSMRFILVWQAVFTTLWAWGHVSIMFLDGWMDGWSASYRRPSVGAGTQIHLDWQT